MTNSMDQQHAATIATNNASRLRRSSVQGTSLASQLHASAAQRTLIPARRKRHIPVSKEFDIFEDEEATFYGDNSSLQGKKAAIPGVVTVTPTSIRESRIDSHPATRRRTSLLCKAVSTCPERNDIAAEEGPCTRHQSKMAPQICRQPRRRTIFVPSDDTTLLTIHPGTKVPDNDTILKNNGKEMSVPFENCLQKSNESISGRLRRPARTSILAAPRRAPLRTMQRQSEQNGNILEIDGSPTGKENIAPGERTREKILAREPHPEVNNILGFKLASARGKTVATAPKPDAMTRSNCLNQATANRAVTKSSDTHTRKASASTATLQTTQKRVSTKKQGLDLRNYPPLQEDIDHVRLFEESWLINQENVLVQLINDVFSRSEKNAFTCKQRELREKLVRLFQDRSILRIHQRLQASLQFGTLSVPKGLDSANETYRFAKDVARRLAFVKLWIQNYSPGFLRAGLEAIIGRQSRGHSNDRSNGKEIPVFIESFLLKNEDTHRPAQLHSESEIGAWAWRRTMLRSLMLVLLLDKAKDELGIGGNLFRPKSIFKSSNAVLAELSNILHPSERNTQQCLSHLAYKLTHEQHPLCDYSWSVSNLAVDLRDGIRLARLVEILLPPTVPVDDTNLNRRPSWKDVLADATNADDGGHYLTPHLRVACKSRVTMLANNELVLRALQASQCMDAALVEVTAADLVDGHRERTLAFLWCIIGTVGLQRLVDWSDLGAEVEAFGGTPCKNAETADQHRSKLLEWATLIARKHGMNTSNASSAFADGRIFESIVDEYSPLISTPTPSANQLSVPAPITQSTLEHKLLLLGSSPSFASVFGRVQFMDHDFVLATLLFLAARVLPASRDERIRRITLRRLATDCATVVQTRARLERAVCTLQRAWRACRMCRLARPEGTMVPATKRVADVVDSVLEAEVDVAFWMV